MLHDVFQFGVLVPCIFEYISQLLNQILKIFSAPDRWYIEIPYIMYYWFNEVFLFLTIFFDWLDTDVYIYFLYAYFDDK